MHPSTKHLAHTFRPQEKRKHRRFQLLFPIRFRSEMLEFEGTAEYTPASMSDAGKGGFFIRSDFLELPGTKVAIQVDVPAHDEAFQFEGEVAWVSEAAPKGPGMGICLDDDDFAAIVLERFLTITPLTGG